MDIVLWVVIAAVLAGLYAWYASIVARRNRVSEALSGIDVQLQQRQDLIPGVLTIAKRFMTHESELLATITELRSKASGKAGNLDFSAVPAKFETEAMLGREMGRLFALSENYPQLKSDGPMMEAQRAYQEVEANVAAARRFYNSSVGDLRNAVQIFPGQLLMGLAGVSAIPPFFETTDEARAPVDASKYL